MRIFSNSVASIENLCRVLLRHKIKKSFVLAHPHSLEALTFLNEGVTDPLVVMSATGSVDGQHNSPFPIEQEQQPI